MTTGPIAQSLKIWVARRREIKLTSMTRSAQYSYLGWILSGCILLGQDYKAMTTRRNLLASLLAGAATLALPFAVAADSRPNALAMPPLLDATGTGRFHLEGRAGKMNFLGQSETRTWGFNQSCLGPTVRVASTGAVQAEAEVVNMNKIDPEAWLRWVLAHAHSGVIRTLIPISSGQPFQSHPDKDSGASGQDDLT